MNEDFRLLMNKYLSKSISADEMKRLALLLESPVHQVELAATLDESFESEKAWASEQVDSEKIYEKIKIATRNEKAKIIFIRRKRFSWIAAAAILVIVFGVWFVKEKHKEGRGSMVPTYATRDIKAPEVNRAMITLSDGRTVYLDSANNGQLALQGNIKLVKLADGKIVYQTATGEAIKKIEYNTLSNPRGSKVIDMVLSDGSHVWLNSGSSITYPIAFIGNERPVKVDGEAYFEVTHDASKPFVVSKGQTSVQVLGTHFDVNAYSDEGDIKVTLLEGLVKVNSNDDSKVIKPGQQASINEKVKVREVDVEDVMSWKEGLFLLDNTDLPTLMRQVSRWYDVIVVYEGKIPTTRFGGGITKDQPLSKILETLQQYGLQFELDGKTLKVK